MSALSSTKETYGTLVTKWKFSPLTPLDIQISPDSLTSLLSVKEVPPIRQTRDKTSRIGGIR